MRLINEAAIMPTFRCNSMCWMCHVWKYPTKREEEITIEELDKLPKGFKKDKRMRW